MILHTDSGARAGSARSPVALHYDKRQRRSSATLWMNAIEQETLRETVLQSWEPAVEPDERHIKTRRTFHRALLSVASQRAMEQLRANMRDDPTRRLWYVGSYVADGVPLLENGVRSARFVAQCIGSAHAPTGTIVRYGVGGA
jgi:predicted NAD/FAD-binding protein